MWIIVILEIMAIYHVNRNAQSNGNHEIHKQRCKHLADEKNRILLGDFYTCFDAVRVAQRIYKNSDGCFYCCNECHSG